MFEYYRPVLTYISLAVSMALAGFLAVSTLLSLGGGQ